MRTVLELFTRLPPALFVASLLAAAPQVSAQDDYSARLDALTAQIQSSSVSPDLWLQRADLRRQHKDFDAAFTDVDQAANLKPDWAPVAQERAKIYFDLGKLPEAVREATASLKLDPANPETLILRARSQVWLKDYEPAVADYNAVLTPGNPFQPTLDLYLERARAQAAMKNYDGAIHGLGDGMKRLGDSPALALPAIEYERERGSYEAALDRLEHASNYFTPASFQATRGEILLQAGRRDDAATAFQTGLTAMEKLPADQRAQTLNQDIENRLQNGLKQATTTAPTIP